MGKAEVNLNLDRLCLPPQVARVVSYQGLADRPHP
jgi:hypothetical protein